MAAPVEHGLTYADLEAMGEDDLEVRELIDGVLYVTPRPLPRHSAVQARITHALVSHAIDHGGEAYVEPGVYFDERNYVAPDVALLSARSVAACSDPRFLDAPPDLVVEVSSPSTRRHDLVRKRALYEGRGISEYWFVDLDADRVEVYRLGDDDRYGAPLIVERGGRVEPAHLPGLAVRVDDVLGPPPAADPEA
jgi:Uma2 family endonuclease